MADINFDKQLKAFLDGQVLKVQANTEEQAKKHAEILAEKLRQTSPVRKKGGKHPGRYAKGWKAKKSSHSLTSPEYTVYNKTDYQLTHLLEHGHAYIDKNGNRVEGPVGKVSHINKAAEKEVEDFVKDVEEHCLDNNT